MRPYTSTADERYRARVRDWVTAHGAALDEELPDDSVARDLVRAMGQARLLAAVVPRSHPASGDLRSLALVCAREELARVSPLCDTLYAMQGLGSYPITLAGNAPLREKLLPAVAEGRLVAAFAITEEGSGSDVASLATVAVRDGASYRLTGEKRFISNAGFAGFYTVFAKTDPGAGARGVSAFVVMADNPGLEVVERTPLLAPHPIGRLRFDACRVPTSHRLGREGEGLRIAFRTLDTFRATVAAAACGMARRALDETIARVQIRHQFGKPLSEFQATRFRLADMATRLEAARGLTYRAAWLRDRGDPPTLAASMAKLAATESAGRIVDDALQLHGGEGLMRGNVIELLYREVRALRIYEGTSEIQRLVIARELLPRG